MRRKTWLKAGRAAAALSVAFGGLWAVGVMSAAGPEGKHEHKAPDAAPSMLDALKPLVGTWETEMEGKTMVAVVSKMTGAGTVYCETMFPGSTHEMMNMYHMDGDAMVVTHYCAEGNQPRMRCKGPKAPGVYEFGYDSCSNLTPGGQCMGRLVVTIKDKDHVTQEWFTRKDGKEDGEHNVRIDMVRKK